MIRNIFVFLLSGILWLFIFSIPVGHHHKRVFDLGFYYIVDTRLVHLVTDLVSSTAQKTGDKANDVVDDVVNKVDQSAQPTQR